ncbi:MAG TPA: CHC2 zinc finger domain-containing protein [Solirubrobacteraceae bacterium]|nr:CHC2 zinc finger domain-containing protein [Solirubrobacteraceae bacterium]
MKSSPRPDARSAGTVASRRRPPVPDRDALLLQLATFAGNEPDGSFLEVRPLKPLGRQVFVPVRELGAVVDVVMALRERHEVFVSACPRTAPAGTAEHVEHCWCPLADCDTPEAVQAVQDFRPLPSLVSATSLGRFHTYWPLRRALPSAEAVTAKLQLAAALGADVKCADAARVMRAVGSYNRKGETPTPVHCVRLELDVFDPEDVVGDLPLLPTPPPARKRIELPTGDALERIPATEYAPLLTGRELGRDGKMLCPFHEERSPSLHCYPEPEQGWVCFGCELGGSIVDFGAVLYGIEPRGRGYYEIRERLTADLLGRAAA